MSEIPATATRLASKAESNGWTVQTRQVEYDKTARTGEVTTQESYGMRLTLGTQRAVAYWLAGRFELALAVKHGPYVGPNVERIGAKQLVEMVSTP